MSKALLDTDIYSEVLKERDRKVALRATAYLRQYGHFSISTVSLAEMVAGLHRYRRVGQLLRLREAIASEELLTLTANSAVLAGEIIGDLERTGQPIGDADPMIAAIAIENDLTLVTGNTSHYERIQALGYPLQLDNWR
jgi:tRNA(fMet)-specific endonuclease VapC